jgi:hypothetical protein
VNRLDFAKLIGGACAAFLFTATVFGPLGFGLRYTDQLKQRVRATLDDRQLERVQVSIERQPALRRIIILTGPVSERERTAAIAMSRTVPGVAAVRWEGDTNGGGAPSGSLSVRYP